MSVQPLIEVLKKLLQLHKSLYQISLEKTEAIKKGNIEALNALIKNEQKHITAIQMMDKERTIHISRLFPELNEPTLSECLPRFEQSIREELASIQQELIGKLDELKAVNELNRELLEQSLQYVRLNLDLLMPDELTNYSKGHEQEASLPQVSFFDSKA
ncbi:flagellar protein FlgN [Niallia oryzisoli]|uniref:Flagellar protein FlgN n=1 Tax=Niallia oryzisoli TaxID=1737571 RepID=A0ABZ2CAS4_9BACI